MKVLITGAGGQLATATIDRYVGIAEVRPLSHAELDITDVHAVEHQVFRFRPDVIINCAAYNRVDQAEEEPIPALTVNALGVRTLVRAAASAGATVVHYSTDFVFDGQTDRPYVEEDLPNPQSIYASSKLLGEWFARGAPRAFVLRVESLFGGRVTSGSIDRIVAAIVEGRETRAFVDRTVSPSYVVDVAAATQALLERGEPGLYHCVGSGYCTWHELALEIARQLRRPARIVPISVNDLRLPAQRPQFAALSNAKLLRAGIPMPSWQDALSRYLRARTRVIRAAPS
jgi:dTDP-4-dehydrorhamnose reductase